MADDWDLLAVVRGCAASSPAVTSTATAGTITTVNSCSYDFQPQSTFRPPQDQDFLAFPDPPEPSTSNGNFQDLNDLFRPFFPISQPRSKPISSLGALGGLLDLPQPAPPPPPPQQKPKQSLAIARTVAGASTSAAVSHAPSPRSKRRKNQMKRVCDVPAEGLSSDMWSWRKYGQKPIKGSPYPRGYYKCSTSKGCLARKQVERNRSDPGMFIVTYTAEHNHPVPTHRNSLAGSTRQKGETSGGNESGKPSSSSPPVSPVGFSPATEKMESREELVEDEDDELSVSDMVIGDDFFEGLEGLTGQPTGDSSSDNGPANLPFQWLANSVTPTAAGEC